MATAQPSPRASLLSGLRTGGVRSFSVPHTAAPSGAFQVPRLPAASQPHLHEHYPQEEEHDRLSDTISQSMYIRDEPMYIRQQPRTASLDGSNLAQQQEMILQRQLQAQNQGAPVHAADPQQQANLHMQMQMQMMQMEVMRLQAIAQMQQLARMQAAEAPLAQQPQQTWREPTMASPHTQTFTSPAMSPLAQLRARQQLEHLHAVSSNDYNSMPMSAALGGRFGGRTQHDATGYNHSQSRLGTGNNAGLQKSDSSVSWRSTSRSVLSGGRTGVDRSLSTSPGKDSASSDSDRASPPLPSSGSSKLRPEPLQFSKELNRVTAVAVASNDDSELGDDSSSSKSDSEPGSSSSPTTPMSGSSHISSSSAREEASKKLFQGLGIGRPSIHVTGPVEITVTVPPRAVSLPPVRQPRGPPGAVDELGDKNFANRIRKQAIGGLGALLEARERRDSALSDETI